MQCFSQVRIVRNPGQAYLLLSLCLILHYQKRDAYFRAGAREVWICDLSNRMTFLDASGELNKSNLCPDFPAVIRIRLTKPIWWTPPDFAQLGG
jgi:hypothetical protein